MVKKGYAVVGIGSRAMMYIRGLYGDFAEYGELRALCDNNRVRMAYANDRIRDIWRAAVLPTYLPEEFEEMVRAHAVDTVIVTSMDRTHHEYIVRAMDAGCDVIIEKPLTIDLEKAAAISRAVKRNGKSLRVAFNYRYAPRNAKVKELLASGVIGEVKSLHFEWLLDTSHGADYFRRWHRDKANSGGLLVHKSTHHFDLVNWWLDTEPVEVFARGGLVFYGKCNADSRGVRAPWQRGTDPAAQADPFALNLAANPKLKAMYLDAEGEDGYLRDQNVFGEGISIEDDIAVVVSYASGALMSYHLTAYSPWEGYRIGFNGTKGRLEYQVVEKAYLAGPVSGTVDQANSAQLRDRGDLDLEERNTLVVRPHWAKPYTVEIVEPEKGGHGGGDIRLLTDLFGGNREDPLGQTAGQVQGFRSILTGIAANKSMAQGQAVKISDLVGDYPNLRDAMGLG